MPRRQQSPETKRSDKAQGNLGQKEAEAHKSGRDRLRHMEGGETERSSEAAHQSGKHPSSGQQKDRS
jgi:hypothetical protein